MFQKENWKIIGESVYTVANGEKGKMKIVYAELCTENGENSIKVSMPMGVLPLEPAIDALIGGDIMSKYGTQIMYENQQVTFS